MPTCAVCKHEHEQYGPREVGPLGFVTELKPGWCRIPPIKARAAPCKHLILRDPGDTHRSASRVDSDRSAIRPAKDAVVPTGWWETKQAATARPRRRLPDETLRARRLGVKIADVRARARRNGLTVGQVLDSITAERRARDERARLARERREEWELAPAYVARVAGPVIATLDSRTRVSRALEVLHAINRMAKWPANKARSRRIYQAKDRLLSPLLLRGEGTVYRFQAPGGLGYCCASGPIRSGESCWYCGRVVRGPLRTWCLVQFEDAGRQYRWHIPPGRVTPALLARAEETEPHDPAQPVREVPSLELGLELAIALVAHVGDLVKARKL